MKKSFTLADANRTLPLVSRIVRDLVARYPAWRELVDEYELMTSTQRVDEPDPRVVQLERQVTALAREIDGYIHELNELGAEVRAPYDRGSWTFPARTKAARSTSAGDSARKRSSTGTSATADSPAVNR